VKVRFQADAVLSEAAKQGRVLVTHDGSSMPRHSAEFIAKRRSPGVIVVRQNLPIHDAAEDLILIWTATDAEEWTDRIRFLPLYPLCVLRAFVVKALQL